MARIVPYKLKSGLTKYEVFCYIGVDGSGKEKKIHKRGFDTERSAKKYANKIERDVMDNKITTDYKGNMTIAEYLNKWISEYKVNVKEGSMIAYRYQVEHYLIPKIGKYKMADYSFKMHQDFINELLDHGGKDQQPLKRNTVSLINLTLSNAFSKAKKLGLIPYNPTLNVEFPKEEAKIEQNHWNIEQLEIFLKYAEYEADKVWYLFFLTLIELGIRKGEAMALCWKDINFKNNTIFIRRNRLYRSEVGENVGSIVLDTTKSIGSTHKIFMTERLSSNLKLFKDYTESIRDIVSINNADNDLTIDDFIFRYSFYKRNKGNVLRSRAVDGAFTRITKNAELPKITIHGLRHSHAIIMREAGIPLEDIQAQLGHTSIKSTQIYAKPTEVTVKRASSIYEHFVNEKQKKD
ncbi:tyrosine-type recombinase/integrase [Companilactobacillus sp. DQM5]|uniref:tyrosine-type recombinase/integrase n=1 Tax=Companilactobacillus sp. DQM5 TaxID=3463359 RepID=UPI0040581FAF